MSLAMILGPVFCLIALTFVLNFRMGYMRIAAVRKREVHIRDIALRQLAWPAATQQVSNADHNQLELPVLFYVLVILEMVTHQADYLFVGMSWVFVALRFVHAYIMVTTNYVPRRLMVHAMALVVLIAMWVIFAVRILTLPAGI